MIAVNDDKKNSDNRKRFRDWWIEPIINSRSTKPNAISKVILYRRIALTLIVLCCFLVMVRVIMAIPPDAEFFWKLAVLFPASLFPVAHLAYLFLVTGLLLFSQPVEELSRLRLTICIFLFLSYFLSALAAVSFAISPWVHRDFLGMDVFGDRNYLKNILHDGSVLSFALLYFLWFWEDRRLEKKMPDKRDKKERKRWKYVDLTFSITLILSVVAPIFFPSFFQNLVFYAGNDKLQWIVENTNFKDVAIIICIVLWWLWLNADRDSDELSFADKYAKYEASNTKIIIEGGDFDNIHECEIDRIFDFGCANGKRTIQLLEFLFPGGVSRKLKIYGLDIDDGWRDEFNKNLIEYSDVVRFDNVIDSVPSEVKKDPQIVHLSHVLYECKIVEEVAKFLISIDSENDTYVIIRGSGPRSFFTALNLTYCTQWWKPTYSHLWSEVHCQRLEKAANLKFVKKLTLRQDMNLSEGNAPSVWFLRYLYGESPSESAKRMFQRIVKEDTGKTLVANDDVMYIYKKIGKGSI